MTPPGDDQKPPRGVPTGPVPTPGAGGKAPGMASRPGGAEGKGASENFVEAFFRRDRSLALPEVRHFADSPEAALPLLGLLSWNAKMLIGILKDREAGTRETKLGSFLQDRFARYTREWTLAEAISLQSALARVDFAAKQTPRDPLGTWTSLVLSFCR